MALGLRTGLGLVPRAPLTAVSYPPGFLPYMRFNSVFNSMNVAAISAFP